MDRLKVSRLIPFLWLDAESSAALNEMTATHQKRMFSCHSSPDSGCIVRAPPQSTSKKECPQFLCTDAQHVAASAGWKWPRLPHSRTCINLERHVVASSFPALSATSCKTPSSVPPATSHAG